MAGVRGGREPYENDTALKLKDETYRSPSNDPMKNFKKNPVERYVALTRLFQLAEKVELITYTS